LKRPANSQMTTKENKVGIIPDDENKPINTGI